MPCSNKADSSWMGVGVFSRATDLSLVSPLPSALCPSSLIQHMEPFFVSVRCSAAIQNPRCLAVDRRSSSGSEDWPRVGRESSPKSESRDEE